MPEAEEDIICPDDSPTEGGHCGMSEAEDALMNIDDSQEEPMASDIEEMSTGMMCDEASRWELRATGDDEVVICGLVVAATATYTCGDSTSGDSSSQSMELLSSSSGESIPFSGSQPYTSQVSSSGSSESSAAISTLTAAYQASISVATPETPASPMVSSVHTDDSLAVEHGSASNREASLPLPDDKEQNNSPGEAPSPQEKTALREDSVSAEEDAAS